MICARNGEQRARVLCYVALPISYTVTTFNVLPGALVMHLELVTDMRFTYEMHATFFLTASEVFLLSAYSGGLGSIHIKLEESGTCVGFGNHHSLGMTIMNILPSHSCYHNLYELSYACQSNVRAEAFFGQILGSCRMDRY